jgi:hypothetical protein
MDCPERHVVVCFLWEADGPETHDLILIAEERLPRNS